MSTISFAATLRRLPPIDRALLVVLVACALFALALGVISAPRPVWCALVSSTPIRSAAIGS